MDRDCTAESRRVAGVAKSSAAVTQKETVALLESNRLKISDAIVDVRVGREDVLPPVVVEIGQNRAPARKLDRHPRETCRARLLDEAAAAVVAEERKRLAGQRRDVDVFPSVVVVVLGV